jgi:hypothetical protein
MTYRRTPAPLAAQGEADRLAGNLAYAEQSTRAVKWQDKLDRQERATADAARDLEREAAKRRRFDEMVERTKRAKERWS